MAASYSKSSRKCAHWDDIPFEHMCINCGRTKVDIGFGTNLGPHGKVYAKNVCNKCVNDERKGLPVNHDKSASNFKYMSIRSQIKQYFNTCY